jgi:hypothetical protein
MHRRVFTVQVPCALVIHPMWFEHSSRHSGAQEGILLFLYLSFVKLLCETLNFKFASKSAWFFELSFFE